MSDLKGALLLYFAEGKIAANFLQLWEQAPLKERRHPKTGCNLPRPVVAVLLEDAAKAKLYGGKRRQEASAWAYKAVYREEAHPTPNSIKSGLAELAGFFEKQVRTGESGTNAEWHLCQMQYLKHARKRPTCPRDGAGATKRTLKTLQAVPAGGVDFQAEVRQQSSQVILNGLVASYRAKLWCMANAFHISLGTVGTERLWRNYQRMARNKGRSTACVRTVDLLLTFRWLREVGSRVRAGQVHGARHAHVAELAEFLAGVTCPSTGGKAPLANAQGCAASKVDGEHQICRVYDLLAQGAL